MIFPLHDDNPTRRTPWITFGLVAINAVVFLGSLSLDEASLQRLCYFRGFVPARIGQLTDPEPIYIDWNRSGEQPVRHDPRSDRGPLELLPDRPQILFSLITCMFMHGGWMHLIGNMWFLWIFGNNVEDRLGPTIFLFFYLAGGIGASACHWVFAPNSLTPVIGASGAVAAILGAYAITWPWARVHTVVFLLVFITVINLPALAVLGFWFVLQIWSAIMASNPGVAWWAHVGGFLVGLAAMPSLKHLAGPTPTRKTRSFDRDDDLIA